MQRWFAHRPLVAAVAALTTLSLLSFSIVGCPEAQQPREPAEQEDPNQEDPTNEPTEPQEPGRPVEPPVLEPEPGQPGQPQPDPNQPGQPTPGNAFLGFFEPFSTKAVRPPETVTIDYTLALDFNTSVASAQLIAAKDANADGQPDGDPVVLQTITPAEGRNTATFNSQTAVDKGLLTNGFVRLLVGVRVVTSAGKEFEGYASGAVLVDSVVPTASFIGAGVKGGSLDQEDHLVTKDNTWVVKLRTNDNAPHKITLLLDRDTNPLSGNEIELLVQTVPAGEAERTVEIPLAARASGTFYYYVVVTDGAGGPSFYLSNANTGELTRLAITNRLVGSYDLNRLDPNSAAYSNASGPSRGAILQGFNFNDLAGSTIASVPDVNNDGIEETVFASRFGKPFIVNSHGIGWGEAFLLYGSSSRIRDVIELNRNAVGPGALSGLAFPGIRPPVTQPWTQGLADITVVPDMDGDDLAELVFSFPRTESISLAAPVSAGSQNQYQYQHPDLRADLPGMGSLEYNAIKNDGTWDNGKAQFTRGGIVIVSSHNSLLQDPEELNRKGDRVMDLHEVGQLFNSMSSPALFSFPRLAVPDDPACEDCEPNVYDPQTNECTSGCADCGGIPNNEAETEYNTTIVLLDSSFSNQGPGGFLQTWNYQDENQTLFQGTPLANQRPWPLGLPPAIDLICEEQCLTLFDWYRWTPPCMGVGLPGTNQVCIGAWQASGLPPSIAWTGFYGPDSTPQIFTMTGASYPAPVGARLLGQSANDRFGAAVASDDTWLYIAAPNRTALPSDVPSLGNQARNNSGIVYMYRAKAPAAQGGPTRSQLWIEPEMTWPNVDAEAPTRTDYTMPVPHQYIIETIGSVRGFAAPTAVTAGGTACTEEVTTEGVYSPTWWYSYYPYPVGTSGYYVDRTPQIVGPHNNAQVSFVKALGDVNDDGVPDFAVGSGDIRQNFSNPSQPTGAIIGGVFIVFGRTTGLEGDYLLEKLVLAPSAPDRLHGVALFGSATQEKLGRVFDAAGDFNGDGVDDVLVGSEGFDGNRGQAVVILGSPTLESPANGWTVADIVAAGRAIRFSGAAQGDLAGANVAGAGDVDGDGLDDVLIAAPGAEGGKGAVYLVYGAASLVGQDVSLADIGAVDVPGAKLVGRAATDMLGGGSVSYSGTNPGSPQTGITAFSRGVAKLGDIDGDGRGDYAVSAMLADPNGRSDAGEVYVIYGRGD